MSVSGLTTTGTLLRRAAGRRPSILPRRRSGSASDVNSSASRIAASRSLARLALTASGSSPRDDRLQRFEIEAAARVGAALRRVPRRPVRAHNPARPAAFRAAAASRWRASRPPTPAPASPRFANIATGAFTTLAGTCAPLKSHHARPARAITWPVPAGVTTARVIPSTRVTGITVESPLNESTTLNAALTRVSVVA